MRNAIFLRCMLASCVLAYGPSVQAATTAARVYHIPSAPLRTTLVVFSEQSGIQILFDPTAMKQARSAALTGSYLPEAGLAKMLSGTGFVFERVRDGVYLVKAAQAPRPASKSAALPQAANTPPKSALQPVQDIIVTAQKREERLKYVPVPVTAVLAQSLTNSNAFRIKDYFSQVPGLSLISGDDGTPTIAIRGVTSDTAGNPTVGVMVNDVPFGSSLAIGGGFVAPELDPSDLDRLEVLRGPQGTLYGAASMGGLLKYVMTSPKLDRFSGRIQMGLSRVSHSSQTGYSLNGALNIPVGNTVAIRASGFSRLNPGFVDNILTGRRDVNKSKVIGTNVTGLWRPSSDFSLKLSALLQKNRQFGSPYALAEPGLSDPKQSFIAGSGRVGRRFAAYTATLNARLAGVDITSITGYIRNRMVSSIDYTDIIGPMIAEVFPDQAGVDNLRLNVRKFSQEVRLVPDIGEHANLLIGGFYTHETTPSRDRWLSLDEQGNVRGMFAQFDVGAAYSEWAGFANLTYHFSDRLDVQAGGRLSRMAQSFSAVDSGPYIDIFGETPSPNITPTTRSHQTTFTYLFTPRFKITPDTMIYARLASGYRPGGPNATNAANLAGDVIPNSYKSDKTQNYELGMKGSIWDGALSYDASIYHIDWKKLQVSSLTPGSSISYYSNGGGAKSQGAELSLQSYPWKGLSLSGWISANRAILTDDFPPNSMVVGKKGDRIPFASRFSAGASIDYEAELSRNISGSIGGGISYVGRRLGPFQPEESPARQGFPSYVTVDLRAGLAMAVWKLDLYVSNLTDQRGRLGGGIGSLVPAYFDVIQPRSFGFSITRSL